MSGQPRGKEQRVENKRLNAEFIRGKNEGFDLLARAVRQFARGVKASAAAQNNWPPLDVVLAGLGNTIAKAKKKIKEERA